MSQKSLMHFKSEDKTVHFCANYCTRLLVHSTLTFVQMIVKYLSAVHQYTSATISTKMCSLFFISHFQSRFLVYHLAALAFSELAIPVISVSYNLIG